MYMVELKLGPKIPPQAVLQKGKGPTSSTQTHFAANLDAQ